MYIYIKEEYTYTYIYKTKLIWPKYVQGDWASANIIIIFDEDIVDYGMENKMGVADNEKSKYSYKWNLFYLLCAYVSNHFAVLHRG